MRRLTNKLKIELQACSDLTDWSVVEAVSTELNELPYNVTLYISF